MALVGSEMLLAYKISFIVDAFLEICINNLVSGYNSTAPSLFLELVSKSESLESISWDLFV